MRDKQDKGAFLSLFVIFSTPILIRTLRTDFLPKFRHNFLLEWRTEHVHSLPLPPHSITTHAILQDVQSTETARVPLSCHRQFYSHTKHRKFRWFQANLSSRFHKLHYNLSTAPSNTRKAGNFPLQPTTSDWCERNVRNDWKAANCRNKVQPTGSGSRWKKP